MALDDLLNLMWSGIKIERGNDLYYKTLEEELAKRIRGIKDDQYEQLISCFMGEKAEETKGKFSERFLKLVLNVVDEKKHRFNVRTMVSVIWACATIDF